MGWQTSWASTALLAALLLAATGAHAARPIEISEKDDHPLNVVDEHAVTDHSRELLSMHYPPPPPSDDTTEEETGLAPPPPPLEDSEALELRVSFNFGNESDADEFVADFAGPHTLPKTDDLSFVYDTEGKTGPQLFGLEFLQSALAGASSNATTGRVMVEQEGAEVYMEVEIFYMEAPEDSSLESDNIISAVFNNTAEPNPGSSRKLLAVTPSLYESSGPGAYGSTTDFGTFQTTVSESGFQPATGGDEDGDGAQGLMAGLLTGAAAVVLSVCMSGISV